jgi:chromosome segregation ATPase
LLNPHENVKPNSKVLNLDVKPEEVILPPCQICPNMNTKYGTNKTYCLNCDLKNNQQEIVPLGLVQQLQEKVKELQKQLEAVATLPATYIDNREEKLKVQYQKEIEKLQTRIKDLESQINQLKTEKNKQYEKFFTENENQKSTHKQKLISLYQEITTHKETIKKLQTEKQGLIEEYTRLENQRQNSNNYLSMPNLYALISKHKNYQNGQHIYSEKDRKEREFLKNLLNELWSFAG